MADRITKTQRSLNMTRIRGANTSIEVKVRKYLFHLGYRYRKNYKILPGKPDIYLRKYNTVIFINGCFWHHHKNCRFAYEPKTNIEFWDRKFETNIINDDRNKKELRRMGYHVITVWECKLKENFNNEMNRVIRVLNMNKEIDC